MPSITTSTNMIDFQDTAPPFGLHHSASYIRSFAYITMKDRLPIILTGIIDHICRKEESVVEKYGPDSSDELKRILNNLIKLRHELISNQPLKLIDLINNQENRDAAIWNECLKSKEDVLGFPPTWYNTVWFFGESYMYRRIAQILAATQSLSNYDPFEHKKNESFIGFQKVINSSAKYVLNLLNNTDNYPLNKCKNDFINLLKLSLWGNRCDLSLSNGATIEANEENSIDDLRMFENNLLIDNSNILWDTLIQTKNTNSNLIIDVVLDNAGYELFTDICFAVYLTVHNFAQKIRFHVKSIPWFVSDTTEKDFYWTIGTMKNSLDTGVQALGHKCSDYLENGEWTIEVESFWTEPFDFSEMKNRSPKLYAKLAQASLVIFKGDLNYRKLLGDINWDYETDLETALRGFKPTNIVSLRTIKADLIVGLSHEKVAELFTKQKNWMITGHYGLIHVGLI